MKLEKRIENQTSLNNTEFKRDFTVSIALPSSILDNAQSPELKTYLAGQVNHFSIFKLLLVIVFKNNISKFIYLLHLSKYKTRDSTLIYMSPPKHI